MHAFYVACHILVLMSTMSIKDLAFICGWSWSSSSNMTSMCFLLPPVWGAFMFPSTWLFLLCSFALLWVSFVFPLIHLITNKGIILLIERCMLVWNIASTVQNWPHKNSQIHLLTRSIRTIWIPTALLKMGRTICLNDNFIIHASQ